MADIRGCLLLSEKNPVIFNTCTRRKTEGIREMIDDDNDPKHICCECSKESYLAQMIKDDVKTRECSYCRQTQPCITVEELANLIETAFEDHYGRTSDQPEPWQQSLRSDRESKYEWYREGQKVQYAIEEGSEIPTEAAEDVLFILEGRYGRFSSDDLGEETEVSVRRTHLELSAALSQDRVHATDRAHHAQRIRDFQIPEPAHASDVHT